MLLDYDLYLPLDRESRTSRKKSRCKEFHPNSGTFLVPEGKFTFAAAKLHIFLKQPNIFAMICPSLSLSQLISEKFANFLDGSIGNYSQILLCFSSSSSSPKLQVLNCLA